MPSRSGSARTPYPSPRSCDDKRAGRRNGLPAHFAVYMWLFPGKDRLLPEVHHRAEDQRRDDRALAQRPLHAEDQRDGHADEHQHDVDLLAQLAHGRAHALGQQLDAALHRRAHQVRFQHQRAAERADHKREHADDQAQRVEGKGHVPEHRIEEEIEHGAAERDVEDLQKLGPAEILLLNGDLPEEKAAVEQHGECADLHADEHGDGRDSRVHRQHADTCLDGKRDGTVHQENAQD